MSKKKHATKGVVTGYWHGEPVELRAHIDDSSILFYYLNISAPEGFAEHWEAVNVEESKKLPPPPAFGRHMGDMLALVTCAPIVLDKTPPPEFKFNGTPPKPYDWGWPSNLYEEDQPHPLNIKIY